MVPASSPRSSNRRICCAEVTGPARASVEVNVIAPVAMERGQRFAIREGGRTIGAGRVTEVLE